MFSLVLLSFHLFDEILWRTEVFNFNEVQFIYVFPLLFLLLVSYLQFINKSRVMKIDPSLALQNFTVLVLIFRSLIYFELILSMVWGKDTISFFCMWLFNCHSAICWKTILSPSSDLGVLVQHQLTTDTIWQRQPVKGLVPVHDQLRSEMQSEHLVIAIP